MEIAYYFSRQINNGNINRVISGAEDFLVFALLICRGGGVSGVASPITTGKQL